MTSHHNLKTKPPNVFCATIKRGALQGEKWATKVGYFVGSNLLNVIRDRMGTKPAKIGHLAPGWLNVRLGPHPAPTGASEAPPQKGLRSAARAA